MITPRTRHGGRSPAAAVKKAVAKRRLIQLLQGKQEPGDNGSLPSQPPPWLDKAKFYRARDVFRNYFFSVLFSHLAALMLGVYVPNMLPPLMATGNSRSVVCLFHRYLRTLVHIRHWYEGDVWNPQDPAHKSILQVRQMHKRVAARLTRHGEVAMSQYDMVLTQFGFIGLLLLFPRRVGLLCSREDLECLAHFWRGVGYLLGIDDRYNLCTDSYEQTTATCRALLKRVLKPSLVSGRKESEEMSRRILQAMNSFIAFLSWEAVARFWFEAVQVPRNFHMGPYEWCGYWLMRGTFGGLLKLAPFHTLFNCMLRRAICTALARRHSYELYLVRHHPSESGEDVRDSRTESLLRKDLGVASVNTVRTKGL